MTKHVIALLAIFVFLTCTSAQTDTATESDAAAILLAQAAPNSKATNTGGEKEAVAGQSSAQNANVSSKKATVKIIKHQGLVPLLSSSNGRSLYLYLEDDGGKTVCYDRCARNWPPLTVSGQPVAGQGIDASLLGTIEREDGTRQVTYNGHPLYRYVRDEQPGDVRGQALGEVFYLVTTQGTRVENAAAPTQDAEISEEALTELMTTGEGVFSNNCAACHGAEGQGQVGPRLAGNSNLDRPEFVANRIINGFPQHGMPAFRDQLSDEEVASAATYVRNSWGNDFGGVTVQMVEELLAQ